MFSMRNQATYTGLTVVSSPPHSPACLHSPALPLRLGCCFKVCPSSNLDFYYKSKSYNFILIKSVLQYLINQASTDFVILGNLRCIVYGYSFRSDFNPPLLPHALRLICFVCKHGVRLAGCNYCLSRKRRPAFQGAGLVSMIGS